MLRHRSLCKRLVRRTLTSTTQDGYIHRSVIPTQHFQRSLPRLPIPKLEDSCTRYLAALHPLLSKQEYRNSEKIVNNFLNGRGKELQSHLIAADKQNKNSSYIHGPWTQLYQSDRRPVVLNYNPFLGFVDDPVEEHNTQINRTTNLVLSSLRFHRTYRDGLLSPDIYHLDPAKSDTDLYKKVMRLLPRSVAWYGAYLAKSFPLDMSQYPYLFQSTRIPEESRDRNERFPESTHLVAIHKGHFYSVEVLDDQGNIRNPSEIKDSFRQILEDPREVNYRSIGYFTSMSRDTWAAARVELVQLNPELVRKVDSALFVLCLDEYEVSPHPAGQEISPEDGVPLIKNGLHGEAYNRWFDKSFNLIVTKNGKAAVHFEHSWGDGVSVLRYFNEIYNDHLENRFTGEASNGHVERLDPKLSENLVSTLEIAREEFEEVKDGFTLDVMKFDGFGKKDLKKLRVSPDAVCQLAFQMAHWRFKQEFVGSYESCSTAAFKFGRTETLRPCTKQTKACSLAFDRDHPGGVEEMGQLVAAASNQHNKLTKEAAMGQGFDRHLFALHYINGELGGEVPALYKDPSYTRLNYITLSTSTLVSPALEVGGFAAVVQDGLGIGYAMFEDWFGTQASYYPPHNDGREYIRQLEGVCEDLKCVLTGTNFKQGRKV